MEMWSRVERFSTFFDFWKPTDICWSGIFLGTQFQNIGNFGCARVSHAWQSFHFQNITGTLKITIFLQTCRHLLNTSKNNLQKENLKKKNLFNIHFYFPKWAKLFLICTVQGQNIFFFHFILIFKKSKNTLPPLAVFKKVLKIFFGWF